MIGLPIVGVAATELSTVIQNGVSGFIHTDVNKLKGPMRDLLRDRDAAQEMGANARRYALERFGIERFAREWEETFAEVVGGYHPGRLAGATVAAAPPSPALEGGIA